jgi:hypothetical protein
MIALKQAVTAVIHEHHDLYPPMDCATLAELIVGDERVTMPIEDAIKRVIEAAASREIGEAAFTLRKGMLMEFRQDNPDLPPRITFNGLLRLGFEDDEVWQTFARAIVYSVGMTPGVGHLRTSRRL